MQSSLAQIHAIEISRNQLAFGTSIAKSLILEVHQLSEVGGGPKSRVLYMHSAILSLLPFARAHEQVNWVQSRCLCTIQACHRTIQTSHRHAYFDIDNSSRSQIRILQGPLICAHRFAPPLSFAHAHVHVGGVLSLNQRPDGAFPDHARRWGSRFAPPSALLSAKVMTDSRSESGI